MPQTFQLANGLNVIYNYRPWLPVVAADLMFNTGSGANPLERPGLASFTSNMLQQGTTTRNAMKIADDAALLGASLGSGATMDGSNVSTSSLAKNFPAALDLVADVVLHPTFPQEEVERRRAARLAAYANDRGDPNVVVGRVGVRALFGPRHPFGYDNTGTEESIKATTQDDLMSFWKANYVPNNAALVVAGDISLDDLKALAEKEFGAWKRGEAARPEFGAAETTKAKVVIVDRPGAQQTTVRLLQIGVGRNTPDYPALEVMNSELGGLFSSRINLNLREEHGYTYGAASFFVFRRTQGFFAVGGGIRTDATAPAVTEIFKEIHRMMDTPMEPEELNLAKDSEARSLPGLFESGGESAGALAQIFVYDLPADYYSKLPERFSSINAAEAEAVAKKYLHPDQMILICVGDRAKIQPELEKLDLGPIEIRDADGKVVQ